MCLQEQWQIPRSKWCGIAGRDNYIFEPLAYSSDKYDIYLQPSQAITGKTVEQFLFHRGHLNKKSCTSPASVASRGKKEKLTGHGDHRRCYIISTNANALRVIDWVSLTRERRGDRAGDNGGLEPRFYKGTSKKAGHYHLKNLKSD